MKKITNDDFVKKAKSVYGERYIYDLVDIKNTKSKVQIICRAHGVFEQTPNGHIYQGGCNKCRYISSHRKIRKPLGKFIEQAVLVHGERYDYSNVKYSSAHSGVSIVCRTHGEFIQSPNSHLKGSNCPKCRSSGSGAQGKRLGFEGFVKRSRESHGNHYEYYPYEYKNNMDLVRIGCPEHGDFYQLAMNHMSGNGCFRCKPFGFDKSSNAMLYVLMSDEYFKVGITSKPAMRFKKLQKSTPFHFKNVFSMHGVGKDVFCSEKLLHTMFKSAKLKGFDGCTEWFMIEPLFLDKVKKVCLDSGLRVNK